MADQEHKPAPSDKSVEQPSLHKREVLWAIAIIIGLVAAPTVGGAYDYYLLNSPVDGLYAEALSALQRSPTHTAALGDPIAARFWTRELVNYPSPQNDARVRFFVTSPAGDSLVLARGRFENGKWTLTYLEVQPLIGTWYVDGELNGFQRDGKLKPIEI
jgi:hypothetical protein